MKSTFQIKNKIFCIGLGKLGLTFSYILCDAGYNIYGYDKNVEIKNNIRKNTKNIEPELNKLISKNKKKFKFEDDFQKAVKFTSVCILILPTPSKKNHEFNNNYILNTLKKIGPYLKQKNKYLINITSTVSPGSCNGFINFLEKKFLLKHGREFIITYNPHLIALGQIYKNVLNPDLIIIGSDLAYGHLFLKKLYSVIYGKNFKKFKFLNLREAEISKISINAYITMKISYSNTVSQIADNVNDVNTSKIFDAIGSDSRIGKKYLSLGGSYSGPCFPRDSLNFSAYLKKINVKNYIPVAVDKINKIQINRYVEIFNKLSNKLNKKINVGICGIAYKKNSSITNFSPGEQIYNKLKHKYKIIVYDEQKIFNYKIIEDRINYTNNQKEFFEKSDVIFICYKNDKFKQMQYFKSKNKKIIIDIWNFLVFKDKNITYKALGVS